MTWRDAGMVLLGVACTAIVFVTKGFGTNLINDFWVSRKVKRLKPLQVNHNKIKLYLLVDNMRGPKGYNCYQLSFEVKNDSHKDIVINKGRLGKYALVNIKQGAISPRGNEYIFEGRMIPRYKSVYVYCLLDLQWGKYDDIPVSADLELYYDIEGIHCGPQIFNVTIKLLR